MCALLITDNIVPSTSMKESEEYTGLFNIGKQADDAPQEKKTDHTSKGRNKDRDMAGGKK